MIDAAFAVVETVKTDRGSHGVAIDAKGKFAYVTNTFADNVSLIDIAKRVVVATVPVGKAATVSAYPPWRRRSSSRPLRTRPCPVRPVSASVATHHSDAYTTRTASRNSVRASGSPGLLARCDESIRPLCREKARKGRARRGVHAKLIRAARFIRCVSLNGAVVASVPLHA